MPMAGQPPNVPDHQEAACLGDGSQISFHIRFKVPKGTQPFLPTNLFLFLGSPSH